MTDIVAELLDFTTRDHERGCTGREYVCSCGYDNDIEAAIKKAAAEIDRLRKENEELKAALREDAERMKADQNAIDSLRLSLSEARATGRREGMEEAARIVDGEITRATFDSFVFNGETAVNRQGHDLFMSVVHVEELLSSRAAAIRAAMEKEE